MAFIFYNANPERRSTIDCTVRAISKVLGLTWEEVYIDLCIRGLFRHDMPEVNSVWGGYLEESGYRKTLLPNVCPNCCTVVEFCYNHPVGSFLVNTDRHVVAIVDGNYYDTWDSGDQIVNYYWEKE